MKAMRSVLTLLIVAAIAGSAYYVMQTNGSDTSTTSRSRMARGSGPVSVIVQEAQRANVPVYLEGVGSVKALNAATVRAQVDGRLLSVNFKEGQDVKKGDVLAKIDPVTYKAQLDQAVAKRDLDQALLNNSMRDLKRFEKVGTLAISQQQIDTQRALIKQQEAQIQSDTAAIENATAILGYTTIVAPFDGRTGIRLIDEGNLVHAGEAGGIVVITQVQPINVVFTLPQQDLPTLTKSTGSARLTAQALSTNGQTELDAGTLEVIDNQVDPQTGTIRLKAEFANAQRQLWPGQFVNVRLLVDTLKNVVVAPTEAIQRGPDGPYVYVVAADNTVALRNVKISRQDEKVAVISEGVSPGDRIVTSGFGRLKDGSHVTVSDGSGSPPASSSTPPKTRTGNNEAAEASGESKRASKTGREAALVTGSTESNARAAQSENAPVESNRARLPHRDQNNDTSRNGTSP